MTTLAPLGPVYQAGTLSGNPLATAAGLTVLSHLDRTDYTALNARAARLAAGLGSILADAGIPSQVPVVGPLVGVFFATSSVTDYAGARASAEQGWYPGLMHGMLAAGVALAPGAYEVAFPGLAHSDAEIDQTLEIASEVIPALAARGPADN